MTRAHHRPPDQSANAGAGHLHPTVLAREARKVCTDLGLRLSDDRLHRVVQEYLRNGYASAGCFRTWFLSYADPTGERAARNVDRQRAR